MNKTKGCARPSRRGNLAVVMAGQDTNFEWFADICRRYRRRRMVISAAAAGALSVVLTFAGFAYSASLEARQERREQQRRVEEFLEEVGQTPTLSPSTSLSSTTTTRPISTTTTTTTTS